MATYNKARTYSQRHLSPNAIRKIQQYLKYSTNDAARYGNKARVYYEGDITGNFDENLFNAIQEYQRSIGVADDGMWGEDTNQLSRLLSYDDSSFSGPNSGAHPNRHTFQDNFQGLRYPDDGQTPTYADIQKVYEWGIQNPDKFFDDSDYSKRWRVYLENLGEGGQQMIKDVWREAPNIVKDRMDMKKLPTFLQSSIYNQGIRDYMNNEGVSLVGGAASIPLTIFNPVGMAGSVIGGAIGADQGRRVGADMTKPIYRDGVLVGYGNTAANQTYRDLTGEQVPLVKVDRSSEGEAIGGAIGVLAGGLAADALGNVEFKFDPKHNPTDMEMRLPRLRGRALDENGQVKPRPQRDPNKGLKSPRKSSTRLFNKLQGFYRRATGRKINSGGERDTAVLNQNPPSNKNGGIIHELPTTIKKPQSIF